MSVIVLVFGLVNNLSAVKELGDQIRNLRNLETVANRVDEFTFDSFFVSSTYRI